MENDDTPDFSLSEKDAELIKLLTYWKCSPGTYAWNLAVAAYELGLGMKNEC